MKIVILGSCVTRDALELKTELLSFTNYFARSSLASIFSEYPVVDVNLDKIESNFQRRMVQADLTKSLVNLLTSNVIDLFIYDAIDERFDLLADPEKRTLATLSNEIRPTGYQHTRQLKKIISGTNSFYALWEKGWVELTKIFREKNALSKIRINRVYWALETENGENFLPSFTEEKIRKANIFLERIYQRIALDLPSKQFYVFPRYLFKGSDSHKWGRSPFHYSEAYYLQLIKKISNDVHPEAETEQPFASSQVLSLRNYFPTIARDELEVSVFEGLLRVSTKIADAKRIYIRSTRVHINSTVKMDNAINIAVYVGPHRKITANATFYSKSGQILFSTAFPVNQIKSIEIDKRASSVSVGVRVVGTQSFFLYDCVIGSEACIRESRKVS